MANDDMAIANEIRNQIGQMGLTMMGAKNFIGGSDHLQFKIGRNAKRVTHIRITLDASDTYTVRFTRVGRAPKYTITELGEVEGVYVSDLRAILEGTGMFLRL